MFARANFFWAIAFEKGCLDILIAQLLDFVLRFFRTKGRLSFVSYFLFCFSGARRHAFNTHMMEVKQIIVPHPTAKNNGVVSVLAERLDLPNGRACIISVQDTHRRSLPH